ncbi:MAG: DUF502 domain-containing protein [Deltaproteobacteria bacterium]|nr:DUF502 domain-containing protein [Deltaproteobacteria bacterium]
MRQFFKKYFSAGIIALLPVAGTLWLLKFIVVSAEEIFRSFIPPQFLPEKHFGFDIPGLGILFAIVVVLLVGLLTRLYIGRRLLTAGDRIFAKIPLGRGVYTAIKQFLGTITGEERKSFRQVVLVEYPSPGSHALGFFTGYASGEVQAKTQQRVANVFIPTTPNPTSGFLLMLPESKLMHLEMSVEDAFKFIVSGGVVVKEYSTKKEI